MKTERVLTLHQAHLKKRGMVTPVKILIFNVCVCVCVCLRKGVHTLTLHMSAPPPQADSGLAEGIWILRIT